jgi:AraC family transcriptional regulator
MLFQGELVSIGEFRCPPDDERWSRAQCIGEGHHVAFPGTAVGIRHDGAATALADATVAVRYRPQERYRRVLVDPRGDECTFLILDDSLVADIDPPAERFAPAGQAAYALQRWIASRLRRGDELDPLLVEEALVAVAAHCLARPPAQPPRRSRCDAAVDDARVVLATRYAERLSLADVAWLVHVSPYHLARHFRRRTGRSLHGYREQLRLRASLERICDGADLSRLALDLGYASHGHFSDRFRRSLGVPPSALRGPEVALRLRTIMEAGVSA